MRAVVYIDNDASVTTYSFEGTKMHALCGDISLLHTILQVIDTKVYNDIPKSIRLANPDIYIRDNNSNIKIPINDAMLREWCKCIVKPKAIMKHDTDI